MSTGSAGHIYEVNERVLRGLKDVDFEVATTDEEVASPFETAAPQMHRVVMAYQTRKLPPFSHRKHLRGGIAAAVTLGEKNNLVQEIYVLATELLDSLGSQATGLASHSYLASNRSNGRERIVADLGRLKDGWAGPGSKAPKATVIRDIERIFSAFENDTSLPNVEVDGEDGTAVMYWQIDRNAFSLMINGDGKISGVLSPSRHDYKVWTVSSSETEKLARRLADSVIAHLIKG
ncbi:MAG: hypothetical protein EOP06_21635 [Proteobacteria bacterium]|nr:MAG: hypothetical protein EOP06_21635 [Pseudomonadota bacterium]